jgi:hypothetical protein
MNERDNEKDKKFTNSGFGQSLVGEQIWPPKTVNPRKMQCTISEFPQEVPVQMKDQVVNDLTPC